MNKLFKISAIALSIFAAVSCDIFPKDTEETVVESDITLEILRSALDFAPTGGEAFVVLEDNKTPDVIVEESWCTYEKRDTLIAFFATENPTIESRYAKVVFAAGDKTATVTLHQFGYKSTSFYPENLIVKADGETISLPYEYEMMMVATASEPWIKLDITEDALNITLEENPTLGSPENPSREGKISWQLGAEKGEFTVTQMNQSFMKEDSNWKVYYDGIQDYQGEDAAYIRNDVTTPGISGKYGFHVIEKSDFEESGMEIGDYIATYCAAEFKADLDEAIEYYSAMGYDLTYDDFLYEESDYEVYNPFDDGDYVALAIGFDSNLNLTGHFAYSDFTVKTSGGGDQPTGYEAWLGEWEVTRGSKTDIWKITEKVKGSTYTVVGIEGSDFPAELIFTKANNGIEMHAQSDIGTYTASNYGECSAGIYGGWGQSSFATGTYTIFTATMNGNKAELKPESVKLSDGEHLIERVQVILATPDGKYLGWESDKTALPTTITKKGGSQGGGDDDPGNASEQYKKWLGSWNVASENEPFTITVKTKSADASFAVRGWQMDEDFFEDNIADFSNGSLVLMASNTPFAESVDIGVDEGLCDFFYYGNIVYQGKTYYVTGDYEAAIATLDNDSKATIKGGKVGTNLGDFDIVNYQVYAVPQSDPESAYNFNSEPSDFPLTMTKASSSKSALSVNPVSGKAGEWVKVNAQPIKAVSNKVEERLQIMTAYQAIEVKDHKFIRSSK